MKAFASTFYNAYITGMKRDQFDGIVDYARHHTYSRTAVFLVVANDIGPHERRKQSDKWKDIRKMMGRQLTRKRVVALMITIVN